MKPDSNSQHPKMGHREEDPHVSSYLSKGVLSGYTTKVYLFSEVILSTFLTLFIWSGPMSSVHRQGRQVSHVFSLCLTHHKHFLLGAQWS